MQLSEFRTIWSTLGGALFATGFVIGADWIFAVSSAPPSEHLSYNSFALYISSTLTVFGILVFVAAMTDKIWLPGRTQIRRDEAIRQEVQLTLAKFLSRGRVHLLMQELTFENYRDWTTNLHNFVHGAFNTEEVALLIGGPSQSYYKSFEEVCGAIQSLILRGREVPIKKDFDPFAAPEPQWRIYLSGISQDIERFHNASSPD